MIALGREIASPEISTDVAIVGAGAAGIALALALHERGSEVLLIDGGGLEVESQAQRLFDVTSVGEAISPDQYRYRVFGGSTVAWTGRCAPLDPIDLEQRPWVTSSGWPITYDDLARHYPAAAELVGLNGAWDSQPERFQIVQTLAGRPDSVEPFLWRFTARKRDTITNFARRFHDQLKAADRLRVLLEADLVELEPAINGGSIAAGWLRRRDGQALRVKARRWILCCGSIENTRLLLNFAEDKPDAFGAVAPNIGRWFMQHPRAQTATIHAAPRQADALQRHFNHFWRSGMHYESGFALGADAQRRHGLLNASAVLRYMSKQQSRIARVLLPLHRAPQQVLRYAAGWEPRIYDPTIALHVDVEQVPDRDSRVFLLPQRDAIGLRKAAIDWRINPLDRRTSHVFTAAICDWIQAMKLGRPEAAPDLRETGGLSEDRMLESYHHLGSTRMSESPQTGVVDSNLKVHGLQNLYVCGGSVMSTGGHANPTLTILALALRLAEHLAC